MFELARSEKVRESGVGKRVGTTTTPTPSMFLANQTPIDQTGMHEILAGLL
jgi:hypothetical protein